MLAEHPLPARASIRIDLGSVRRAADEDLGEMNDGLRFDPVRQPQLQVVIDRVPQARAPALERQHSHALHEKQMPDIVATCKVGRPRRLEARISAASIVIDYVLVRIYELGLRIKRRRHHQLQQCIRP